ncbi:protein-methionine-sulfoxide reductase catalytic subunit MsrP [Gimesia maris]|uniref:protein-methionine-sulfoxide reductase catalytic subunit MsrP n=1 Tax=Gimesia maris TaxID=122 RepID=UPI00118B4B21|nr:protein-methionine-sulfoxide reductase catalytic subunit MsrP [Gimesia maris]QDT77788.1 Sulfoxide reductase catalytic subunit YedY precursor [Gimesia maris]|tara:strand:- start:159451 stop:160458 length:1008 start_codon:yes stop_codon:yes gene_type:complete
MNHHIRKIWNVPEHEHTPVEVFQNRKLYRREFLQRMGTGLGIAGFAGLLASCEQATKEEIEQAGATTPLPQASGSIYPAQRNPAFKYGRPETDPIEAEKFTNFYEFTGPTSKQAWKYVEHFQTAPWSVTVEGECAKPRTFDLDDLYKELKFEERAYRHRCVETWAMCVPWTGFPLASLLKLVEPKASAKFVAFETFNKPQQAPYMESSGPGTWPWPYTEGLTMPEAMNDLAFIATGLYGAPLLKQNGAPIRLVVPWKYGFKSGKSIVKIRLTKDQPATFWNTVNPEEYGFVANVEPDVPHPRWSQRTEWMLGTEKRYDTKPFNGYGEYVASLYTG